MDDALLLTVEEAGHLLKMSRAALYPLVIAGEIESITIGRSRRIPREAVIDFIKKQQELSAEAFGLSTGAGTRPE